MSEDSLSVMLDRREFTPGETLRGAYQLARADLNRVEEVEVTIGWHTEGDGLEARAVEHREVHRPGDGSLDRNGSGKFSVILPASPLSYQGMLIKVCWTVQARASFSGEQRNAEAPFQLGHVARVVADSPA